MADRSVSVKLDLSVAGFIAGVEKAKLATKDFANSAEQSATENRASWDKLSGGMLITGGAIAIGVGAAIKAYADFSKEMSGVQAVSGANAKQMDALSQAAIKAGADTVFSASEAAKAEAELAKAGVSTANILGGALTGSLNLASAGGLDLANAATISAQAMNIFKLGGQDVAHIADVLASGANKSAADVGSLGDALKQGGLVAAQTGLHLEDTVGILSMFADSALVGADAGTSLKTMLMRLVPQSLEAQNAMTAIGFSAYDASGKFVGMESVAQQLKTGLGGLTEQQRAQTLTTIFGSDATRAASILYEQGAAGVKDYTAAVNDNGAAQRMASIQLNNLSGDFEQLRGSIDTALIQSGSAGNGVLRDLVQGATGAVNAFGNLPAPLQQGALGLAAVAAAGLLTGGAFLTVMPKITAAKAAMVELGIAARLTRASMLSFATGPIGLALGAITIAVGLFAKSQMDAKGRADDLRNSLDQQTGAITAQTRALVAKQLQDDGAFQRARDLGVSVKLLTDAAMGQGNAIDILRGKQAEQNAVVTTTIAQTGDLNAKMNLTLGTYNAFGDASSKTVAGATNQAASFGQLLASVMPINDAIVGQTAQQKELATAVGSTTDATGGAVGPTQALAQSEKELVAAADAAKKAHDALTAAVTGFGSAMLAARGDARGYEAAIDAATASVKANGRTLDIGTEKGRNNQAALDAIATSALKMAESNLTAAEANGTLTTASVKVTGEVGKARKAFIDSAVSMGMSEKAAGTLATQAGLTTGRVKDITDGLIALGNQHPNPKVDVDTAVAEAKAAALKVKVDAAAKNRRFDISADGSQAISEASRVREALNLLHNKQILLTTTTVRNERKGALAAGGGYITGPGSSTSDSIPAMLSNGEFVVRAASVKKVGLSALHQINNYAVGGLVTPRYVSAPVRAAGAGSAGGDSTPPINLTTSIILDNHVLGTSVATWSRQMVKNTGSSGLRV